MSSVGFAKETPLDPWIAVMKSMSSWLNEICSSGTVVPLAPKFDWGAEGLGFKVERDDLLDIKG